MTAAVARALGVADTGDGPIAEKLGQALADRRLLLLLDNVEHVVDAAPELAGLLRASAASVLATSRILLRVGGERSLALGPLEPAAAMDLLVDRARAVKPDFELTDDNTAGIAAICTALDNAPLALELAAARLRVLTPAALVDRLDHALSLLTAGDRDLPERQRTLRATIDWSAQLLHPEERELLCGSASSVRGSASTRRSGWPRTSMRRMRSTRSRRSSTGASCASRTAASGPGSRCSPPFASTARELEERGVLGEMQERHARFYAALADATAKGPTWSDQVEQMARLADERDELRGAVDHFLATRQYAAVAQLTWNLYWFWWVSGQLGEVRRWMSRLLAPGLDLDDRSRIIALFCTNSVRFGETPDAAVVSALAECVEYFHAEGDRLGEGLSLVSLAIAQMSESPPDLDAAERSLAQSLEMVEESGDPFGRTMVRVMSARAAMGRGRMAEAFELLDEGLAIARGNDDRLGEAIALNHLGWARLLIDDPDGARAAFTEQLRISSTFGHEEGFAYGLEGMSAVAAATGDIDRAGLLFGAAETVRLRKGLTTGGTFSIHGRILERALANGGAETFEAGRRAGRSAELADMVELALAGPASADVLTAVRGWRRCWTPARAGRETVTHEHGRRRWHPDARPAPARVRELDAEGAGARASCRPRRDRAARARAGDVRARRAAASAARAVPGLPRPERHLRRPVLGAVRLGRAGGGGVGPRGRVEPRARHPEADLHQAQRASAGAARRAARAASATTTGRRTSRSRMPRSSPISSPPTSRPCSPSASTPPGAGTSPSGSRLPRSSRRSPCGRRRRSPGSSAAPTSSRPSRGCSPRTAGGS